MSWLDFRIKPNKVKVTARANVWACFLLGVYRKAISGEISLWTALAFETPDQNKKINKRKKPQLRGQCALEKEDPEIPETLSVFF